MGVYRLDVIRENNLYSIPGLYHEDIVWTTKFMFNARRARYTQTPLYKYFLHSQSLSRSDRDGVKNIVYQRHYMKITRLLEKLNQDYADRIPIYPEFHEQIVREALRVCHSVRKEPDNNVKQIIISDIFSSSMYKQINFNFISIKFCYQAFLWIFRLYGWHEKRVESRCASQVRLHL